MSNAITPCLYVNKNVSHNINVDIKTRSFYIKHHLKFIFKNLGSLPKTQVSYSKTIDERMVNFGNVEKNCNIHYLSLELKQVEV